MIMSDPIFLKESIGTLAMNTYKKLVSLKFINFTIISERIYRRIVDIYFNRLNVEEVNPASMFITTKMFMKTLPSLHKIDKYCKNGKSSSEDVKRNLFFIKLCLDLYEIYYKKFDLPLLKNYKGKFLKVAINFYSNLSEENFSYINELINESSMKMISK
jgi:hypothetical protein